jgi:ABC-type lipoprotein export system ATPase subunit
MTNLFSKGSEWRKWDLHIHTPASFHWNGSKRFCDMTNSEKNDELKSLIVRINQSDVKVFGIMDYWTFDGYFELTQFLQQNPDLKCNKTILPGMELRIEAPVSFRLNIHALLSNTLSPQQLRDFQSNLKLRIGERERSLSNEALIDFAKSLDPSKAQVHGFNEEDLKDENKLLQLGSMTAKVTQDCLKNAQRYLEGLCLIILPHDTSDGFAGLNWKTHPSDANFFMQSSDVFEARGDDNIDLFLGRKTAKNELYIDTFIKALGGKPKPVVSGSDAHKISDYGIYPNDKCTWIKSDPTFDGLKYTIYDPSERVRITQNDPGLEFPKPYFKKIEIQDALIFSKTPERKIKFNPTNLELNSGLVAIIGGRGTGKSILLDTIAKTFNKPKNKDRTEEISMEGGFSVVYTKNTGETEQFEIGSASKVIYLHVHQREVQDIVKDPGFLSDAILDMLGISSSFNENSLSNEVNIEDILCQIKECKDWLDRHSKENNQSIIDRNTQIISTITTENNKKLIDGYVSNISLIKTNNRHINKLSSLQAKLTRIVVEINNEVQDINLELKDHSILSVDFAPQFESIQDTISSLNLKINKFKHSNLEIQKSLAEEQIEGDPDTLLQKVDEYRSEIDRAQEIITQINTNNIRLETLTSDRNSFVYRLDEDLNHRVIHINEKWNDKLQGRPEWDVEQKKLTKDLLEPINICGEIFFDVEAFYRQLTACLNLNKFRSTQNFTSSDRIRSTIRVNGYKDYKTLIENKPIIQLNQSEEVFSTLDDFLDQDYFNQDGSDKFLNLLFSDLERDLYLKVLARIKYDDKKPEDLSIGQRGTLYLCLKLATDSFFDPIVIDQPEDDLDNDFIMKRLVPIFLTIKKYRQVIMVTHNANLVINADAEQVIVAENNLESLSYLSGSLENPTIRAKICDVLEGGREAFIKREQKYGFK